MGLENAPAKKTIDLQNLVLRPVLIQLTILMQKSFIYLFIYLFFVYFWQFYNWTYTHIKKRLAFHKGKPLMTLIEVNTKCAYLEAH